MSTPLQLATGFVACALTALASASVARPVDYATTGRNSVRVEERVVHDAGRAREIPYAIFRPATLKGRHPVVVFSHGNGGTRQDGRYLAEHLASHGYVVVHIQHVGSDASIWADTTSAPEVIERMKAAAADRRLHDQRYRDVPSVLDELAVLDARDPVLRGHLDLQAIGMSGHSWGALTTLVLVGARDGLDAPSYRDDRIKAAIALSPSLPRTADDDLVQACRDITVPLLHVTGTRDSSPVVAGLRYERRLGPFNAIAAPNQHLLVLVGADHMLFPGVDSPLRKITEQDQPVLRAVKAVSLAFWDAYLRHDASARDWLTTAYPQSGDPIIHSMLSRP